MKLIYAGGDNQHHSFKTVHRRSENRPKLQDLCRDVIRRKIREVRPNSNLFVDVAKLEIPSLLKDFLVFNVPLEIKDTGSQSNISDEDEGEELDDIDDDAFILEYYRERNETESDCDTVHGRADFDSDSDSDGDFYYEDNPSSSSSDDSSDEEWVSFQVNQGYLIGW